MHFILFYLLFIYLSQQDAEKKLFAKLSSYMTALFHSILYIFNYILQSITQKDVKTLIHVLHLNICAIVTLR